MARRSEQGGGRYNFERLAWFRRWLLPDELTEAESAAAAADDELPVQIFVMGGGGGGRTESGRLEHGGRWRAEREWPVDRAVELTLFLSRDGALTKNTSTEQGSAQSSAYLILTQLSCGMFPAQLSGKIADRPPPPNVSCRSLSFKSDPSRPVPTLGGAVVGGLMGLLPESEGGLAPPFGNPADGDQAALWRVSKIHACTSHGSAANVCNVSKDCVCVVSLSRLDLDLLDVLTLLAPHFHSLHDCSSVVALGHCHRRTSK